MSLKVTLLLIVVKLTFTTTLFSPIAGSPSAVASSPDPLWAEVLKADISKPESVTRLSLSSSDKWKTSFPPSFVPSISTGFSFRLGLASNPVAKIGLNVPSTITIASSIERILFFECIFTSLLLTFTYTYITILGRRSK